MTAEDDRADFDAVAAAANQASQTPPPGPCQPVLNSRWCGARSWWDRLPCCLALRDLPEAYGDEFLHERPGERSIDGEVQRALGAPICCQVIPDLGEHRSAMRQVAQMVLEGGEAGDNLAVQAECRRPVGEALLGVGDNLQDCLSQRLERAALRLVQSCQVSVYLLSCHPFFIIEESEVILFMRYTGMPAHHADMVRQMPSWPLFEALAFRGNIRRRSS